MTSVRRFTSRATGLLLRLALIGATGLVHAQITTTTGTWRPTASMHTARSMFTATRLRNGKVLVVGGENELTVLATAELFDPKTGTWSLTGSLNIARWRHTATLLNNGQVLVTGGRDSLNTIIASAEVYDPRTGAWSLTGSMHSARDFHTATRLADGQVLVAGGNGLVGGNSTTWASAELFTPASTSSPTSLTTHQGAA